MREVKFIFSFSCYPLLYVSTRYFSEKAFLSDEDVLCSVMTHDIL